MSPVDKSAAIKKKAQQLVAKGDVDGAIAEFDKLFAGGDRDPYDFILVADLLAKRGSMQESVRRYRQAIDEYTRAELYKNAIAVCKKILRISKEDLAIHRTLGDLYGKEGLYGDAQIHYLEFAEGSIRRQDYEAALDVLDEVLKLSPDGVELSEKYVEIAMRADLPERGGRELLRRAGRARKAGRLEDAENLEDRASTLAPGLAAAEAPDTHRTLAPGEEPEIVAVAGPIGSSDRGQGDANGALDPSVRDLGIEHTPSIPMQGAPPEETVGSGAEELAAAPDPQATPEPAARQQPAAQSDAAALPGGPPAGTPPAAGEARVPSTAEDLAESYRRAGQRDRATEQYWKAGEEAVAAGDLPRARSLLLSLLEVSPGHEPALRRLVEVVSRTGEAALEARVRFDLAEVYLAHEEWDLARSEYLRCLEIDHLNERARMRVQRLDALHQDGAVRGTGPIDFDAIPDSRPQASVSVRDESPINMDSLVDLEEIIDEFRQGVSERISGEDHESHYDLGMAYMEMGLYDEAIGEFQVASNGSPLELKCLEMIALCFLEKNEPASAVRELQRALDLTGHGPEETISIRYNLGVAHERLGNLDRALQHFEEVYLLNVDFLKVSTKVRELKQRLAQAGDRG